MSEEQPVCQHCAGSGKVIERAANGMRCRVWCALCRWAEVQAWERRLTTKEKLWRTTQTGK